MKVLNPNVTHKAPQLDEIKENFQKHPFAYGLMIGLVIGFLAVRSTPTHQNIEIVIPRGKY